MPNAREKRAPSLAPPRRPNTSQLLCEGCEATVPQRSPGSAGKMKGREKRCASVKDPSRVTSFEASKVNSVRKPKQKAKKKPVLVMSQHETPVLGKYFIATNSSHRLPLPLPLPQARLHSTSDHNNAEHRPSQEESKLAEAVGGEEVEGSAVGESGVKAPLSIKSRIERGCIMKAVPAGVEGELDSTIDKLKSKQQTIEILNKTIQTRLVDVASAAAAPRGYITREDTYDLEMNFYVEKITLLQKELYEKNRMLKASEAKNEEFSTLARNTKKLLKENSRLREEAELWGREVAALKKLLAKTEGRLV